MRLISGITGPWLGLCRKPPAVLALQMTAGILPEFAREGVPDGGSGGPGTIRRGIGAALSGMRTLNRNRQLLWFTLLAGLVLAGNAIGMAALRSIGRTMQPDIIAYYVPRFFLGFATMFCLVFLLAGLFLSIPPEKSGSASFFAGLGKAKKYSEAIFLWSVVLALAGLLLFRIWVNFFIWLPPDFRFLDSFGPDFFGPVITQFPFNWTLDWNMFTEIPGYGGRSLLLWIYPFGVMEALNFLAITLLLFILTPFVVPLFVLGQKTLSEAVTGSFAMMKKIWIETSACAAFLGVVVSGVFFAHLLIQAASGMVSPYNTVIFHPPDAWIALALLYNLVLLTVAFIVATVGGIAVQHLYISAKSRQITPSPGHYS